MKKLLKLFILLALLVAAAAYVLITWYPETPAGVIAADYYAVGKRWTLAVYEQCRARIAEQREEAAAEQAASAELSAELEQVPEGVEVKSTQADKVEEGWRGLQPENWYSGKRLSGRALKGQTVLVYEWDLADADSVRGLLRVEELYQSFKHKKFLVLASHRGGRSDRVASVPRKKKLTFSCYEGAGLEREPANSDYPYYYVVNPHGKLVFRGRDERAATEAVVNAISESFAR